MVCKSINKIKNVLDKITSWDKIKAELLPLSNNLCKYFDLLGLLSKGFINKISDKVRDHFCG